MRYYAARCVLLHGEGTYEERITLWQAKDEQDAIRLAESDAKDYAEALDLVDLGVVQLFSMHDQLSDQGCEVFSLLRDSTLEPTEYVERFFATGAEYQRHDAD